MFRCRYMCHTIPLSDSFRDHAETAPPNPPNPPNPPAGRLGVMPKPAHICPHVVRFTLASLRPRLGSLTETELTGARDWLATSARNAP
jgi:hypothetical protein